MPRAVAPAVSSAVERQALRRRVRKLYEYLGREDWDRCFALIDPRLRDRSRVNPEAYADSLRKFKQSYREIRIRNLELSIYPGARENRHDERPFAYVYVYWQDGLHQFHLFRERWVRDGGKWYTRVVGLVHHENRVAPT